MRLLPGMLLLTCLHVSAWVPGARAQTAMLSLSPGSGAPGGTVSMQMSLAGDAKPAGLQWTMNYPEMDLAFVSAEPGPSTIAADKSVQCERQTGTTQCLVIGFNQNTISDGVVAVLTFTIDAATSVHSAMVTLSNLAATSGAAVGIPITGSGNLVIIGDGITGVLDAASFEPFISPGSIVSIFGSFAIATATAPPTLPLPTDLNGFSATFNGVPGAIFGVYESPGFSQANVQVPWEIILSGDPIEVRVHWTEEGGQRSSEPFGADAGMASPGIYMLPGTTQAIVTNFKLSEEDDVIHGSYAQPEGQPAAVGGVITIWLNGLGPVTPAAVTGDIPGAEAPLAEADKPVRVLIGGVAAQIIGKPVLHPTLVALNQINAIVSPGTPTGDNVPIVIEVDCGDNNVVGSKPDVTIAVRPAP